MADIYWNGPKASKDEVRKELMKKIPDITNGAFTVVFQSDGSGPHVSVIAERKFGSESNESPFHSNHLKIIPAKFMGWRCLKIHGPYGWVGTFYDADGNRSITKSADDNIEF